jgi:hypothetical protein
MNNRGILFLVLLLGLFLLAMSGIGVLWVVARGFSETALLRMTMWLICATTLFVGAAGAVVVTLRALKHNKVEDAEDLFP